MPTPLGMVLPLTRLRAIVAASSFVALAAVAASLEPAGSPRTALTPASLLGVRRAAASEPIPADIGDASAVDGGVDGGSADIVDAEAGRLGLAWAPRHAGVAAPDPALRDDPREVEAPAVAADELDEVRWTVERGMRLDELATNWGMWVDELRELNPELDGVKWVDAGASFVVYRRDVSKPNRSVGAPNRGRLLGGIPMPEGAHWQLRGHRPRAYGSRTTIGALVDALRAYGAADPAAPPLRIGEISRRSGGRIAPHVSHRSGRDVDIGYVLADNPDKDERFWRPATAKNIDAPRTWAALSALIETGRVQQVFMSSRLQPVIAAEAAKRLPPEEVARIFSAMNPDPSIHTIVKHEPGHRDHMHVRFVCEPGNNRCRSQSSQGW